MIVVPGRLAERVTVPGRMIHSSAHLFPSGFVNLGYLKTPGGAPWEAVAGTGANGDVVVFLDANGILSLYFVSNQSSTLAGIAHSGKVHTADVVTGWSATPISGSFVIPQLPAVPATLASTNRDTPTIFWHPPTSQWVLLHTARRGTLAAELIGFIAAVMGSVASDPNVYDAARWSDPVSVLEYDGESFATPFTSAGEWMGGFTEVTAVYDPDLGYAVAFGTGLTEASPGGPFRWRFWRAPEIAPFNGLTFGPPVQVFSPLEDIPLGQWGYEGGGAYHPHVSIGPTGEYHLVFRSGTGASIGHFVSKAKGVAGSWAANPNNPIMTLDRMASELATLGQGASTPSVINDQIGAPSMLFSAADGKVWVFCDGGPLGRYASGARIFAMEAPLAAAGSAIEVPGRLVTRVSVPGRLIP